MTEHKFARQRVGDGLRLFGHWMDAAKVYAAKQIGLHPTDLASLGYIAMASEPLNPKQIIAYLGVSSGSGTALLDRLELAGYIKRKPNPQDRRGVLIELDRDKAAEPIAFYQYLQRTYVEAMDRFTPDQLNTIAEFLEAVGTVPFDTQLGRALAD
jgi:DNA-binding MarR family transcriptional regulator